MTLRREENVCAMNIRGLTFVTACLVASSATPAVATNTREQESEQRDQTGEENPLTAHTGSYAHVME